MKTRIITKDERQVLLDHPELVMFRVKRELGINRIAIFLIPGILSVLIPATLAFSPLGRSHPTLVTVLSIALMILIIVVFVWLFQYFDKRWYEEEQKNYNIRLLKRTLPEELFCKIVTIKYVVEQQAEGAYIEDGEEKLFGYTGRLAGQLYENDRKKYRAVTAAAAFGEGFLFFFRSFPEYERQTGGSPPSADTLRIIYLITLPVIVFAVGAALPSDLAALGMKKRSYAMLASVGAPRSRIYRIAVVESAYFAFNLTVFSTISAVIGSYAMLICERLSAPGSFRVFTLPLRAVPVCIAVNASVVLLFLICESVNVKCAYDGGITMNRE